MDIENADRLAMLAEYDLLDTPPEAQYDRITRVAAAIFAAPIAIITVVDGHRLWYKSHYGTDQTGVALCDIPEGAAFCAEVTKSGQPLVVEDAIRDSQFAVNPLVCAPNGIRFYAGVPLTMPDGYTLGTLCVLDVQPRSPTAEQMQRLRDLGDTVVHELAQRRQSRQDVQAAQQRGDRFAAFAETSALVLWTADATGYVRELSDAWSDFTGQSPEEIEGTGWSDAVHPDDLAAISPGWAEAVRLQQPYASEYRVRSRDGVYRWFSARVVPVHDAQGRFVEFMGTCADIDDKKEALRALRASEARFRSLVDNGSEIITLLDAQARVLYQSPSVSRILGHDVEALVGRDIFSFVHPDDALRVSSEFAALGRGTPQIRFEVRFRDAQHAWRWLEVQATSMLRDPDVRAIVVNSRDITERKSADTALVQSDRRYRALSELVQAYGYAFSVDKAGATALEWVTDSVRDVLGYEPEALLGQPWGCNFVHPDDRALSAYRLQHVLAGNPCTHDVQSRHQDGSYCWIRYSVYPEHDSATGRVIRIHGAGQDVTATKEAEHLLVQAKEQAEEALRLRDILLTNMSHEFRTPLTAILGFADVLRFEMPDALHEYVDYISQSGQRLMNTLVSALELSQLQAGARTLNPHPAHVAVCVQDTVQTFAPACQEKGLTLQFEAPSDLPVAHVDVGALNQVVSHLMSNAVKFTPHGTINVTLSRSSDTLVLRVADTGIGISEAFHPHLFDAFWQESTGLSRTYEGSGIGLAITRWLVTLMEGAVAVESEPGKGSVFTVTFPLYASGKVSGKAA